MRPPHREPARQATLREHNLALVLRELAETGPVSRARLAARTGLTKGTVSSLIEDLLEAHLLAERPPHAGGPSSPVDVAWPPVEPVIGRPGISVWWHPRGPVGIGLEINVDYVATCTVDLAGSVHQRELVVEDFRGADVDAVLGRAAHALRRGVDAAQASGRRVAGVAVAVPGLVEAGAQVLRLAPNLGWQDVHVVEELRRRAGLDDVSVVLDNEANFAALGEMWCGGQVEGPAPTFVHVSGEIGVGAGIVLRGSVFHGVRGFGGELGHLPVQPDGPACSCGSRGCLEPVAGQEAILRRAGLGTPASTSTGRPAGSVEELAARARSGDERAVRAVEEAGRGLGIAVAALVNLLDVEVVVLGGLYATLAPWLLDPLHEEVARRSPTAAWRPVEVLVSRLGGDAAVRGAATAVVRGVVDDPSSYLAGLPVAH